ncbi:heat-shock protein, partial [Trifolium medium]|nr:heat-shock protein [Trifolium medium]
MQAQCSDVWQWQHEPVRGYTVSGAYQLLQSQQTVTLDAAEDLIWHQQVPLK